MHPSTFIFVETQNQKKNIQIRDKININETFSFHTNFETYKKLVRISLNNFDFFYITYLYKSSLILIHFCH